VPDVYDALHALAERSLRRRRSHPTLQPTALVHEAYLRLADQRQFPWRNRAHVLAIGARMIRRVLIDHLRARGAERRGGGIARITLSDRLQIGSTASIDLLALDEALQKLAARDARKARLVELRFFGGLSVVEAAAELKVSERSAAEDWALARAFLRRELGDAPPSR